MRSKERVSNSSEVLSKYVKILSQNICAAIAQLGERKTEDLKVTGSIPVRGIVFASQV